MELVFNHLFGAMYAFNFQISFQTRPHFIP